MIASIKRRLAEGEGGFTLIELLVVMIIISILMAVAVPAYLGQKQKAIASTAKTNIKSISDTIESCAASRTDGLYTGCTTLAAVALNEPSLATVTGSGNFTVAPNGTEGYKITGKITVSGATVTYTYDKSIAGAVVKTCAPVNVKVCPSTAPGGW